MKIARYKTKPEAIHVTHEVDINIHTQPRDWYEVVCSVCGPIAAYFNADRALTRGSNHEVGFDLSNNGRK